MPVWIQIMIAWFGASTLAVALMCRFSWAANPLRDEEYEAWIESALDDDASPWFDRHVRGHDAPEK